MIAHHRGYTINVKRERALGGWDNLYFSIMRDADGCFVVDDFSTGADTIRDFVGFMKDRIDGELASDDPWGEKAEEASRTVNGWYRNSAGWSNVPPDQLAIR